MKSYLKLEVRIEMPLPFPSLDVQQALAVNWAETVAEKLHEIDTTRKGEVSFDDAKPFEERQ